MSRLTPEELEARLHALLRAQPPRRAPATLEQRVLAEIGRRQALPWWRKSYSEWPAGAQLAFLAISATIATVAVVFGAAWFGGLRFDLSQWVQPIIGGLQTIRAAGDSLAELARGWMPTIPTTWWYAAILAAACGYAALVGVGATAYRLLWQPR